MRRREQRLFMLENCRGFTQLSWNALRKTCSLNVSAKPVLVEDVLCSSAVHRSWSAGPLARSLAACMTSLFTMNTPDHPHSLHHFSPSQNNVFPGSSTMIPRHPILFIIRSLPRFSLLLSDSLLFHTPVNHWLA